MQDAIEGYRFDVPQGRLTGEVYLEEWQFFPFKYQDKTHLIISFFAPRIAILPCCPANSLITRLLWAWQSFVLGLYLPYIAIKTTIFKGFRGLLEHFWVQKTESIEQKGLFSAQCLVISVFFSLFANEIRGTFRNYVPTQCQIRPDVVPDTSRRSIKYIPTYSQVHPNAYSSTCERYFKYLRTLLQVLANAIVRFLSLQKGIIRKRTFLLSCDRFSGQLLSVLKATPSATTSSVGR